MKGVGREGEVSLPDKSTFHLCVYCVCCVGSVLVRTRSCELSTDGKLRPLIVPRLEQILLFSNDDDFCSDHWNRTWSIFKCFCKRNILPQISAPLWTHVQEKHPETKMKLYLICSSGKDAGPGIIMFPL